MLLNENKKIYHELDIKKSFEETRAFYKIAKAMIKPKGGNLVKEIKWVILLSLIKIKLNWLRKKHLKLYMMIISTIIKLK